jgi:hypothetical protein
MAAVAGCGLLRGLAEGFAGHAQRIGQGHDVRPARLSSPLYQPHLLEDIRQCFAEGLDTDFAGLDYSDHEECYDGHGRVEKHSVCTILNPAGIRDQALWQDLKAITMVFSERQEAGKEKTEELRYYIGSRAAKAKAYANFVRSHWGIENRLYWVLDVSFDEDGCRMRADHSPENSSRCGDLPGTVSFCFCFFYVWLDRGRSF